MSGVKIAVLVSGGGTNMQAIIDEIEKGNIKGNIEIVISSKDTAFALTRAANYGIEGVCIGKDNFPDAHKKTEEIMRILEEKKIELVVLAGYMSILDNKLIEKYENRMINIHPSLIPSFCGKGYYGTKVHEAALEYGVKVSGATVHFVDEGTDTGPIILQEAIEVKTEDTVETLAQRVLEVEHRIFPKAIKLFCEGKLIVEGRRVIIKS